MKLILIIILSLIYSLNLQSQCSDAGVCIVGRHNSKEFISHTSLASFGYVYGYSGKDPDINGGLNNIYYGSFVLDAELDIFRSTRLAAAMPYTFVTGPLGYIAGAGDLSVLFTKDFMVKKIHKLSFSLGGKFATGKVNSTDSLPQRYMPGLGTNDIYLGAAYSYSNYYFGIAYQKPFGRSANYVTRLKRGDDLMFRMGYFENFKKIGIKAELITILRLMPSSILNTESVEESFVTIDGSNEAQVNLLAAVTLHVSREIGLTGQAAIPLLHRNYNYDGLKRTLSLAASVSYFFNLR